MCCALQTHSVHYCVEGIFFLPCLFFQFPPEIAYVDARRRKKSSSISGQGGELRLDLDGSALGVLFFFSCFLFAANPSRN